VYESRDQRARVEEWINAQPTCPSRKQTQRQFPDVLQKHIRAALQSRKDRDKKAALKPPICTRCGGEVPEDYDYAVCPESNFTLPCVRPRHSPRSHAW